MAYTLYSILAVNLHPSCMADKGQAHPLPLPPVSGVFQVERGDSVGVRGGGRLYRLEPEMGGGRCGEEATRGSNQSLKYLEHIVWRVTRQRVIFKTFLRPRHASNFCLRVNDAVM